MNKITYTGLLVAVGAITLLMMTVAAAPMEPDDEQTDNDLVMRSDNNDMEYVAPWDSFNSAALRKLLLQLDADERLNPRVVRSWPQAEPRAWGLRRPDARLARQWRADKRQVRFRQCYFNPISCFRK